MPERAPHVALLQENQAAGGVRVISQLLCQGLRQQGWTVTALALNQTRWLDLLRQSARADVLLAGHNFKPAYVAWLIGRLLRKPVVVWVHGPLDQVLDQARANGLKRAWLRWLYRQLPCLVFVSQAAQAAFLRFMQTPLAQPGLHVIANTVGDHWHAASQPLPRPASGTVRLACVGRLSAEKQPGLVLQALRLLPPRFTLTLVGDGPLRAELAQHGADLLATQRLQLAGHADHGPALYQGFHLSVLASRYEGFALTFLESLACGVACVALPIAALQEMVADDAPYLLAADHSAQALADAIERVCALPGEQVQADMARIVKRYKAQDFLQRWQSLLQSEALC